MFRHALLLTLCLITTSTSWALSTVYRGVVTSKEVCRDNTSDPFSDSECQRIALGKDRACFVTITTGRMIRTLTKVEVKAATLKSVIERRSDTISAGLKNPYLMDASGFFAYSSRTTRNDQVELKVASSDMAALAVNVYTGHRQTPQGRIYQQVSCSGFEKLRTK